MFLREAPSSHQTRSGVARWPEPLTAQRLPPLLGRTSVSGFAVFRSVMGDSVDDIIKRHRAFEAGDTRRPVAEFDLATAALYGGIAGLEIGVPEFELINGIVMRRTF